MGILKFFRKLSKDRSAWVQLITGLVVSFTGIGFVEILWPWISHAPYTALILPIIASYTMTGGILAGFLTTIILITYAGFRFLETTGIIPYLIFNLAGVGVFYLVKSIKKRLQMISDADIRAKEGQRLKFAASAGRLGIWEWDIPNDHLLWDDQMLEFYGLTRESFSGTVNAWEQRLHPDDSQSAFKSLDEALKTKSHFNSDFRIIRPNGETRYIQAQALTIRDDLGRPLKMFGLNRDVTEEKRALQQIQELNAYLETALEQSQAGIVIAEPPNGEIKFANHAALKITGRTKEEIVDNIDASKYGIWGLADLSGKPIESKDYPIVKAMLNGDFIKEEFSILRPNGEKRIILVNAAPIRRKDSSIMAGIVIFLDTTAQHQLLEKVQKAQKEAEEAMMAKARFLDVAAHELRTPVTAVSLMIQLAQRQATQGLPVNTTVINRMKTQMDRLSRLVVDLLEVSQLDRGVLELKYEWTDLSELITDCISTFKIQFPDKQILFSAPAEPVQLEVDPVRIYEVISNLIDNAMKYTPDRSTLDIRLESTSEKVHVSITDEGPGLSEHAQKRLFGAFERENFVREKRYSGLGLGLFISRGIIELHGGTIGVESQLGHGSTFFFDLPKAPSLVKTGTHS